MTVEQLHQGMEVNDKMLQLRREMRRVSSAEQDGDSNIPAILFDKHRRECSEALAKRLTWLEEEFDKI